MLIRVSSIAVLVVLGSAVAYAQGPVQPVVIGTFHWQLQPYCNTLSLTVVQEGSQFRVQGTESCDAADVSQPVQGVATADPAGTIYFSVRTSFPGGSSSEGTWVWASLSLATLNGTWQDDADRRGQFIRVAGPVAGTNRRGIGANTFLHVVSSTNRQPGAGDNVSCFSHPLTDGRPGAFILAQVNRGQVSHGLRPFVGSTYSLFYDDDGTGLAGSLANNVWCISRDDSAPMPLAAAFTIRLATP
jgi:hypothetical protein